MPIHRVALITGGASGMGLAVAEMLVKRKDWHIYILDRNAQAYDNLSSEIKSGTYFRQVDITNYPLLGSIFKNIYTTEDRIDFVFANAGIGGPLDFYESYDSLDPPPMPDTSAIDVNLRALVYTARLAAHYFKLKKLENQSMVITASNSALYPVPSAPLYAASKHGALGFMRSIAPVFIADNIRVNAICPGAVPTPLLPPEYLKMWPKELLTPVESVAQAVVSLIDGNEMVDAVGTRISKDKLYGQTVELSVEKFYFRSQPDYCDKEMERVIAPI